MNRIDATFRRLRAERRKAFIAFITAGYPSLSVTGKLIEEFARIGVDIIELGVPFSDPLADGPVIQGGIVPSLAAPRAYAGDPCVGQEGPAEKYFNAHMPDDVL
jgi:tryptophan synthase alpha subunit